MAISHTQHKSCPWGHSSSSLHAQNQRRTPTGAWGKIKHLSVWGSEFPKPHSWRWRPGVRMNRQWLYVRMNRQRLCVRMNRQRQEFLSSGGSGVNVSSAPRNVKRRVCWWSGYMGKEWQSCHSHHYSAITTSTTPQNIKEVGWDKGRWQIKQGGNTWVSPHRLRLTSPTLILWNHVLFIFNVALS